jgi:hypothetical protein
MPKAAEKTEPTAGTASQREESEGLIITMILDFFIE